MTRLLNSNSPIPALAVISLSTRLRRGIVTVGTLAAIAVGFVNLEAVWDWNGFAGLALMWICIVGVFAALVFARMTFEPSDAVKLRQRVKDFATLLAKSDRIARHLRELHRSKTAVGEDLITAAIFSADAASLEAAERGFVELAIFQPLTPIEVRALKIHDKIFARQIVEPEDLPKVISNQHEALEIAAAVIDRILAEKAARAAQFAELKSAILQRHQPSSSPS